MAGANGISSKSGPRKASGGVAKATGASAASAKNTDAKVKASGGSAAHEKIVLDELKAHEVPKIGLIDMPSVVRTSMDRGMTMKQVHNQLYKLNASGKIEMHPTSGSEFLPPKDHAIAPPFLGRSSRTYGINSRETVFQYGKFLK